MTGLPRHARRRGTRGFAAFLTGLAGFVVTGIGLVVVPAASLDPVLAAWVGILTVAAGLAHFVAVYGLARGRAWSGRLVASLAAAGIGAAAYVALVMATGIDPFASAGGGAANPGDVIGLSAWMIGLWVVAAVFAVRGVAPAAVAARTTTVSPAPAPAPGRPSVTVVTAVARPAVPVIRRAVPSLLPA